MKNIFECIFIKFRSSRRISVIIISCTILLFNACANHNEKYLKTFCEKELPIVSDTSGNYLRNANDVNTSFLGMPKLSKGSDTFFLRMYISVDSLLQVFQYSCNNVSGSAQLYQFPIDRKSGKILFDKTKDDVASYQKNFEMSKINDEFISKLGQTKVLEMPDYLSLTNYSKQNDSRLLIIEYANKCSYHIASFAGVSLKDKGSEQVAGIQKFLDYMRLQFKFGV